MGLIDNDKALEGKIMCGGCGNPVTPTENCCCGCGARVQGQAASQQETWLEMSKRLGYFPSRAPATG